MRPEAAKPPSRREYATRLAANAAAKPLNIVLLLGTMAGAVAVGGGVLIGLAVALVIYAAGCVRTFLDPDEAEQVAARARTERRAQLERGQTKVNPSDLAPELREHLVAARAAHGRIHDTIDTSKLPYVEVFQEVDKLVGMMEHSACRAQLLAGALRDTPTARVRDRLRSLHGSDKTELIDALEHQLAVQEKMQEHVNRFSDQMERVVIELDTIRGNLLAVAASTDAGNQQRLAAEVRSLRDGVGALSSSMDDAFREQ